MSASGHSKFMVQFIESIGSRHVFIAVWVGIGALFIGMMWKNYQKTTRRNFRKPDEGKGTLHPVDRRQLPTQSRNYPVRKE